MSHPEQREFCESIKNQFPSYFENCFVLDIGSLDINGNNQNLFNNCLYLGVDILPGNNVHIISKGHELNFPDEIADCIVSTECFEHDRYYQETFTNILRLLKPGGFLMFTCATTGRPEHGTSRTTPQDSPLTNQFQDWCDYYKNLTIADFFSMVEFDEIFENYSFSINQKSHDLYFWGIKKGHLEVDLNRTLKSLENIDSSIFERNKHIFSDYCKQRYLTNRCKSELLKYNHEHFEEYQSDIDLETILPHFFEQLQKLDRELHDKITLEMELCTCKQQLEEVILQNVFFEHEIRRYEQLEAEFNDIKEKIIYEKNVFEQNLKKQKLLYNELNQQKDLIEFEKSTYEENLHFQQNLAKQYRQKYEQILKTNSWKLTRPLREVRRWINTPKKQFKRYLKSGFFYLKKKYQQLPLSQQTRMRLRIFLANHFPKFLLLTGTEQQTIHDIKQKLIDIEINHFSRSRIIQELVTFDNINSQEPKVSVIIPIYGNLDYTLKCIYSIFKHKSSTPFEVIVVDDLSPDDSYSILKQLKNIRLFKNKKNQGFIRTCNYGAFQAKGEYLYFLNNDTQVTEGWLDELYATFENLPNTGLVGSKLIYPDGVLQEAGGIIWQDGSAWNFGRGQNQNLPKFNYAREVDYCSGASIMIPKVLFNSVGGFDEHYLPAYCEDSDLALKIRQLGYRVIYQPMSVIIHYEGISSGTDLNKGVKSYQVDNSKKLFSRWQSHLAIHQPNGIDVDSAKDRRMQFRVLVLDHCTPTPDKDAGSVTALNVMLLLREMNFQVTFVPEDNFLYMPKYTTELQKKGIEVLYHPYVNSVKEHLEECGTRYDVILLIRPGVAGKYMAIIEKYAPQAKYLYLPMDLHFLRMMREQTIYPDAKKLKEAKQMQQLELEIFQKVDCAMVHSDIEMLELKKLNTSLQLETLPLIIDFKGKQKDFQQRKDILFIGGFQHHPNVDAMIYFVNEIMPLLRIKLPGVCLNIIGSNPTEEVYNLASQDVVVHGYVEDVQLHINQVRVSIAPLRYGAGVKGKVGTAMACGLPVVATSIAAEGMFLTHQENVLIADNPQDFADEIVRLYQDEYLWQRISENSLEFAKKSWSKEAVWQILSKIIKRIGLNVMPAKHPLSLY